MEQWQQDLEKTKAQAIADLLASLEQNDTSYLLKEIERPQWAEKAKEIDDRLAVVGLRLVNRPWERR